MILFDGVVAISLVSTLSQTTTIKEEIYERHRNSDKQVDGESSAYVDIYRVDAIVSIAQGVPVDTKP